MASSYFKLRLLKKKRTAYQYSQNNNLEFHEYCGSISKLCRICLKDGYVSIFGDERTPDISEYIHIFGGISVSKDDKYPKYICKSCHSLLKGAIVFRESAKESDLILYQSEKVNHELVSLKDQKTDIHFQDSLQSDVEINIEFEQLYKCNICKLSFNSDEDYVKHRKSKQHKNLRVQCPICHRLLTAQLYGKHVARHQSASHLVCDVCGKLYRKDNLIRHLQLHNFDLPFQCQQCPYRGRFMESLRIHMRTHSGEKPFSCEKCELRFLTRSNLNRHILSHKKERPFKCIECTRCFYTKQEMNIHFKADHSGFKDFACRICSTKYSTRKAMMRHELRVHKRVKMAKGRVPLYLQAEYQLNDITLR